MPKGSSTSTLWIGPFLLEGMSGCDFMIVHFFFFFFFFVCLFVFNFPEIIEPVRASWKIASLLSRDVCNPVNHKGVIGRV